jgi:positive regulator of sigma E activity
MKIFSHDMAYEPNAIYQEYLMCKGFGFINIKHYKKKLKSFKEASKTIVSNFFKNM